MTSYTEVETKHELILLLKDTDNIEFMAFQDINLEEIDKSDLKNKKFSNCIFLGCNIDSKEIQLGNNCLIFPHIKVPYNIYRSNLYNKDSLFNGYEIGDKESYKRSKDNVIYQHYLKTGKHAHDIKESLARRMHDHSISDALYDYTSKYDDKKIIAVMGGHAMPRGDKTYTEIALLSKQLSEQSCLMMSGGGPGAMEATHLGAWFAGRSKMELLDAIEILSQASTYTHDQWLDKAFEVINKYPIGKYESLGIPTWLYGHEPPTPFASHIAKYFANSVREEGLLALAKGGVIFSPGSAGTVQEIFMDATQNHYITEEYASPMVFMDSEYWTKTMPIYPLLKKLMDENRYKNLILSTHDTHDDIIAELKKYSSK